jgi:hypothetical protein
MTPTRLEAKMDSLLLRERFTRTVLGYVAHISVALARTVRVTPIETDEILSSQFGSVWEEYFIVVGSRSDFMGLVREALDLLLTEFAAGWISENQ